MEKLTSLDLYNCPVTLVKAYREQIFELLPKLEILDGINAKGEEVTQSDDGELCMQDQTVVNIGNIRGNYAHGVSRCFVHNFTHAACVVETCIAVYMYVAKSCR